MKISAVEEYGVRCVLRLAMEPDGGRLTVQEIAVREGLTVPYVAKLMSLLREAGLVESVRGRTGGFILTRPAAEISVEEVLSALGEPLFRTNYCENHAGTLDICAHQGDCSIRPVWQVLGMMIHHVLRGTSLADLRRQETQVASYLQIGSESALAGAGIAGSGVRMSPGSGTTRGE